MKEFQKAPHDVDAGISHLLGCLDITDVPPDIVEGNGLGELGSEALGELLSLHILVIVRDTIELVEVYL